MVKKYISNPKTTVTVKFDILGSDEYQTSKYINEFLRIAFREFAATHNILDYEVINDND